MSYLPVRHSHPAPSSFHAELGGLFLSSWCPHRWSVLPLRGIVHLQFHLRRDYRFGSVLMGIADDYPIFTYFSLRNMGDYEGTAVARIAPPVLSAASPPWRPSAPFSSPIFRGSVK